MGLSKSSRRCGQAHGRLGANALQMSGGPRAPLRPRRPAQGYLGRGAYPASKQTLQKLRRSPRVRPSSCPGRRASLQPLLLARGQSLGWDLLLLALQRTARLCARPCGSHCAPTSCTLTRAFPPHSEQSTPPPRGRSPWWLCSRLTFQDGDVDLWHGDGLVHGGARVTAAKALGSRGLLARPGAVLFMVFFIPEGIKALQGKP